MKRKKYTLRMKLLRVALIPFGVALWCVGWTLYYFGEQCRYMYNPERFIYQKLHKNVNLKEGEKMRNEKIINERGNAENQNEETEKPVPMKIDKTNEGLLMQDLFNAYVEINKKYGGKLVTKEPTGMYMIFFNDHRLTGLALGDVTLIDVLASLGQFRD